MTATGVPIKILVASMHAVSSAVSELNLFTKELVMADKKDDAKDNDPVLKDVESGSDADETPVAEPGKTPPDPNAPPKS